VLAQIDQREHDTHCEQRPECKTDCPPCSDAVDWRIAGCAVDEGAIGKYRCWRVFRKCEVAIRVVGEGAVVVEGVVVVGQGCTVEVDAVDEDICGVVARWEGHQLADLEEWHVGEAFGGVLQRAMSRWIQRYLSGEVIIERKRSPGIEDECQGRSATKFAN